MSTPPAGTTKKRIFARDDYLAPLPIPTGEKPQDVLNTIWRKNEVFIDIGNYSIGSAVMLLWPMVMLFAFMGYLFRNDHDEMHIFAVMTTFIIGIPTLFLIQGLLRPPPYPCASTASAVKCASHKKMASTGSCPGKVSPPRPPSTPRSARPAKPRWDC